MTPPAAPRTPSGAAGGAGAARLVRRQRLLEMLDVGTQGPVTLVSAPPGSGKTTLVRSWLASRAQPAPAAWVDVQRDETDAIHFWGQVLDAIRESGVVGAESPLATLVPTPHVEPGELVGHVVAGLRRLDQQLVLILDDVQHVRSRELLDGIETLLSAAPPMLRVILLSRRDPAMGLHKLRLSGQLTEIRAANLEFTEAEAGELLVDAGLTVTVDDVASLHHRTEGWATGLRLAALSMAQHPSPDQFVAEFAGSERTVADYLLGEVLHRQADEVRDLLLRTCILDRVSGEVADLLTGRSDGDRILHDLADANALVVATDVARSSYRYHHLLLDLLRLELRRELPGEIEELHARAARWYAAQAQAVEAIRHARSAADWELACDLLGEHWVHLLLDGEETVLGELLDSIPREVVDADAEVATMVAAHRLRNAQWAEADGLLTRARETAASLAPERRARADVAWATVQLMRAARRLGGADSVVDEASSTLETHLATAEQGGTDLGGLALLNLGIAKAWTFRFEDAEADLERGLAAGRTIGRPYIEIGCLVTLGNVSTLTGRVERGERLLRDALAVADRVGWTSHPLIGAALMGLAATLVDRGMLAEGERYAERADPILARAGEPSALVGLRHAQGMLAMARGRYGDAVDAFRDAVRLVHVLRAPHGLAAIELPWQLRARLALGETDPVREALAEAPPTGEWANLAARLCLAEGDPRGALEAVAPVLDGTAPIIHTNFMIEALVLSALAARELGDADGAEASTERAIALSEPGGNVAMMLTIAGFADLVKDHPTHRSAHGAHLQLLRDLTAGVEPQQVTTKETLTEPLKERELAVLRFLPTNLTAGEIGDELFLSVHTIKTHMRKLYAKLGVHTRAEAVQQGRALGLLAPARRSH